MFLEGVTWSQSVASIIIEDVICTLQRVLVQSYLKLYCVHGIEQIIAEKFFIKLYCLNVPKVLYVGPES